MSFPQTYDDDRRRAGAKLASDTLRASSPLMLAHGHAERKMLHENEHPILSLAHNPVISRQAAWFEIGVTMIEGKISPAKPSG
jgi:hypothetical protein